MTETPQPVHYRTRNPWHGISPGEKAPQTVTGIIEITKGSKSKFELDKVTGLLKLDRVLFSSVIYPANYGFIPQTYCDDHDPLDILVISQADLPPLCLVDANVIGVMRMVDQGEIDDKIIAVAANDVSVNHITKLEELPPHTTREIQRFFEDYKKLEHKHVEVEEFLGAEDAQRIVVESIELYNKTFGNTMRG